MVIIHAASHRPALAIYTGAVISLFGISGLYHRVFWGTRAEGVFRRLDHATIFIAIAATYTPVAMMALPSPQRGVVLAVVWTGSLAGAFVQLVLRQPPRHITVALYVVVGWSIVPFVHLVWISAGVAAFVLLLAGGVLHSVGATVYAKERPSLSHRWFGFHELFHVLVIAAVAAHYVVVVFLLNPAAVT